MSSSLLRVGVLLWDPFGLLRRAAPFGRRAVALGVSPAFRGGGGVWLAGRGLAPPGRQTRPKGPGKARPLRPRARAARPPPPPPGKAPETGDLPQDQERMRTHAGYHLCPGHPGGRGHRHFADQRAANQAGAGAGIYRHAEAPVYGLRLSGGGRPPDRQRDGRLFSRPRLLYRGGYGGGVCSRRPGGGEPGDGAVCP